MAKNLSRKYATMSDDERRRFALEEEEGNRELPAELSFEEPRNEDNMGAHFSSLQEEVADPDHRDGMSALLDDEQHDRAVREGSQEEPAGEEERE
jgi:hypothetical protein